jgi:hypothetical protein
MHGVGIGGRMHRDRLDAQLLAGAQNAQGDLAAVGDQNFLNMADTPRSLEDDQRLAVFHRLPVLDQNGRDNDPDAVAGIWFMVFIASTISRVWPSRTVSPTLTKAARRARAPDRRCRPWARARPQALDVAERRRAVSRRFACAEPVEVRTVENENRSGHAFSARGRAAPDAPQGSRPLIGTPRGKEKTRHCRERHSLPGDAGPPPPQQVASPQLRAVSMPCFSRSYPTAPISTSSPTT